MGPKFERGEARQILVFLVGNALPLFLVLYGLKCIVTLSGTLTESYGITEFHMLGSFRLVSVTGMAAVMTGLGDISLALFGYLSGGPPPDEDRSWLWRVNRAVFRWGCLAAAIFLWHQAHKLNMK